MSTENNNGFKNGFIQTVMHNMTAIERIVVLMMNSTCIPAERRNHGDCFAACLEAMEHNISPFQAALQMNSKPPADQFAPAPEQVADALLMASCPESMAQAEALLNKLQASDETASVLVKLHQYKLHQLAANTPCTSQT